MADVFDQVNPASSPKMPPPSADVFDEVNPPKPKQSTDPRARIPGLVGAFAEGAVVDTVKGLANALRHPIDTATGIVEGHRRTGEQAMESFGKGKNVKGAAEAVMAAIPVVGPMLNEIGNQTNQAIKDKNPEAVARNLGQAVAVVGAPEGPGALKAASKSKAALVTKGAAKGAAEGVRNAPSKPLTTGDLYGTGALEVAAHLMGVPPGVGLAIKGAVRHGPAIVEGALKGIREELGKAKATEHRAANPGTAPVEPTPKPPQSAGPIASDLPSGRRPPTREQQAARADSPSVRNPIGPVAAVTQELLDGIAKDQTGQKFSNMSPARQKLVRAIAAKVAKAPEVVADVPIERAIAPDVPMQAKAPAIEADSPLSRLSPEKQAEAQALKDLMGDTGPSPDAPARQFEAGARAKKVWNMSDLLAEHGISAQDAALMTDEMWNQATEAINLANKADWAASKGAGKPPQRHHLPGAQSRAQIVKELQEIEARKATEQ